MKVAILVDGDFYIRRHKYHFKDNVSPRILAQNLMNHCLRHIDKSNESLYRIFFYDCPPIAKKVHNPKTGRCIDYSKTSTYTFRTEFHNELRKKPNTALRLGYLDESNAEWTVRKNKYKNYITGKVNFESLQENDFTYYAKQKGVDMKIGLDIATLTHKKLVDKIVLIAGDSDFVPAAKLARREGINFVLDPMMHKIRDDLAEHIDRLKTTLPKDEQNSR